MFLLLFFLPFFLHGLWIKAEKFLYCTHIIFRKKGHSKGRTHKHALKHSYQNEVLINMYAIETNIKRNKKTLHLNTNRNT